MVKDVMHGMMMEKSYVKIRLPSKILPNSHSKIYSRSFLRDQKEEDWLMKL